MSKKVSISIPKPCHENWDAMTTVEKGKFCGSCQKQVVDFSTMSDCQIANFFRKPTTGSVCGRFMNDQLERDIEIPKKRIPWLKYFFQFALPAMLLSCRNNSTVGKIMVPVEKNENPVLNNTKGVILTDVNYVEEDSIIPGEPDLSVRIDFKSIKETTFFPPLTIQCSEKESVIELQKLDTEKMDMVPDSIITLPEVILQTYGKISCSRTIGTVTLIANTVSVKNENKTPVEMNKHSEDQQLSVYPNPVSRSSSINIKLNNNLAGEYQLSIVNLAGQLVHQKQIKIDKHTAIHSELMPNVPAGSYFMVLTNKSTGKRYSSPIIIL